MKKRILPLFLVISFVITMMPIQTVATESEFTLQEPAVTSFTVTYQNKGSEETVSLLPLNGEQEPIVADTNSPLTFSAVFANMTRIDEVYITSTTVEGTKYLRAEYSEEKEAYIATGYFDPNDKLYIPGTIGVSYTKKNIDVTEEYSVTADIDLNVLESQLKTEGVSLTNIKASADGTSVSAQVVFESALSGATEVYVDAAISTFVDQIGADKSALNQWLGVYENLSELACSQLNGADGKEYVLYTDYGNIGDSDTWLLLIKDLTGNKYTKLLLNKTAESIGLGDISDALTHTNTVSKLCFEYAAISDEMETLRKDVAISAWSAEKKAEANEKIDALEQDKQLFLLGTTVLPLFVGATVITGGAVMSAAPALLFSALLGGITSSASYFWDARIGMIQGCDPVKNVFYDSGIHNGEGGWIPLTQELLDADNQCIISGGRYYLAEDVLSIVLPYEYYEYRPLDVSLCLHGHNVEFDIYNGTDNTLRIYDCKYCENQDGTITGGNAEISNQGTLYIDRTFAAYVDGSGETVISGGTTGSIYVREGGTVSIIGGQIGDIKNWGIVNAFDSIIQHVQNFGTLRLSGGTVINQAGNDNESAVANYGKAELIGAECDSVWCDEEGELVIRGGSANHVGNGGKTTIKRGIVEDVSSYGELYVAGGEFYEIGNSGSAIISGGTADDIENSGEMVICAGTIGQVLNYADLTIAGGVVNGSPPEGDYDYYYSPAIYNQFHADLYITGGTVRGIANSFGSQVTISGGLVTGNQVEYGAIVNVDDGQVNIIGGTVTAEEGSWAGLINNFDSGQIAVSGGVITSNDHIDLIYNWDDGSISVNGGTLSLNNPGACDIIRNAEGTVDVTGGVLAASGGAGAIVSLGGSMTISGGEITGEIMTSDNGCISGGRIVGEVSSGEGQLTISGGEIAGNLSNFGDGQLTISGGTFTVGESDYWVVSGSCTLLIEDGSRIEFNGHDQLIFTEEPIIQGGESYTGGVLVWDRKDGNSKAMTLAAAEQTLADDFRNFIRYLRLESDLRSGVIDEEEEILWSYSGILNALTVTGETISNSQPIYVASYNAEGQMTAVSEISVSGGSCKIGNDVDLVRIFWLDADWRPKCKAGDIKL